MIPVEELVFAPTWDQPVSYMQRTRSYYLGLGYENPYVWAHYLAVPFSPLKKPLSESTLALITTAAPYQADKGNQGPGSAYNALAKFYEVYASPTSSDPDLRISHVGVDRKNADMAEMNAWFPLAAALPNGKSLNKRRGTPQYSTISLAAPIMTVAMPCSSR